jgi:glycine oxidase
MLAPYTEAVDDPPMLELCAQSLREYPEFVRRVQAASQVDPRLRLDGILTAAFDDAGERELDLRAAALRAQGIACERLDRTATVIAEPMLGAHARSALLVSPEGSIDNRRLGRALQAACRARGVTIEENAGELSIECDARRALGVRSDRGFSPAGAIVNAAGAWAATIPGLPERARPPVVPRKGQMLALAVPQRAMRRTTWVPGAYLVPRDDGRLLIGATVEDAGFDTRVTAGGLHRLLDAALTAAPALGDFTISETWAGLRPGSPDGRPTIGATSIDGLFVAAGHFRNGILLTPITARLLADAIEGNPSSALAAFSIARFETSTV